MVRSGYGAVAGILCSPGLAFDVEMSRTVMSSI